jgi:hypothetical protein
MRLSTTFALVVGLSTVIAGCSAAATPAPTAPPQPTPQIIYVTAPPAPSVAQPTPIIVYVTPAPSSAAPTHDLNGTISLFLPTAYGTTFTAAGETCQGVNGYNDIAKGAPVTAKDGSGTVIGTGQLTETGHVDAALGCVLPFVLAGLPDAPFYTLEVSHRGPVTYSRADLAAKGWNVALTLGS